MRYRTLGTSELRVSEIALGSWLTYAGGVGADVARSCTEAAFDVGINFFDTANSYGRGAAETVWGPILSRHPRDSYVLSTKVWGPMADDPAERGLAPAQIAKQIDASLRRLRTDHVDLYHAHRFDPTVPIEDTLAALHRVVEQGKARYLGFSEWTVPQIRLAIDIAGPALFVSSQPQYSMLWRAPEAELFALCREHHIANIVWSPLAQGILTGKYLPRAAIPEGTRFASPTMGIARHFIDDDTALEAVQRLAPIAAQAGLTMETMALAWVLRRGEVCSAITGASNPDQVRRNAAASGVELTPAQLTAIDIALADTPRTVPTLATYAQPGIMRR